MRGSLITAVVFWISALCSSALVPSKTVLLKFGDSFTSGGTWADSMVSAGFAPAVQLNFAYNGQSMGSVASNQWPVAKSELYKWIGEGTNLVATLLIGSNPNTNMGSGYSSPTEYSSTNFVLAWRTVVSEMLDSNIIVICFTVPPVLNEEYQSAYSQPEGYVLWKSRINGEIRLSSLPSFLFDLAAEFAMNTTNYPDGQHPSAAVYGWIGTNVANALLTYDPSAPVSTATNLVNNLLLPKSAEWSVVVNCTPGDNEAVTLDPPVFKWFYRPDPVASVTTYVYPVYRYRFQCATDSGFSSYLVNVVTSNNMYNLLAPFSPASRIYWRVEYLDTNLAHVAWSDTRSFTFAPSVQTWDRSMLADATYLNSKLGSHPFMLFNSANKSAVAQFVRTNDPSAWLYLSNNVYTTIAAGWWNTGAEKPFGWWDQIAQVAFVWQLTGHSALLSADPMSMLALFAQTYMDNDWDQRDVVSGGTDIGMPLSMACAYDWLYDQLSTEQRALVVEALSRYCNWVLNAQFWYSHDTMPQGGGTSAAQSGNTVTLTGGSFRFIPAYVNCDLMWYSDGQKVRLLSIEDSTHATVGISQTRAAEGFLLYDRNKTYPPPYQVFSTGAPLVSGGHQKENALAALPAALAVMQVDNRAKEFWDYAVNYNLAQVYPYGTKDGVNQGRGYILDMQQEIFSALLLGTTFPEAHFERNPFWAGFADWYQHFNPIYMDANHEPWGDAWYGRPRTWTSHQLKDLAGFVNSGAAYQHYSNSIISYAMYIAPRPYKQLTFGYYYPLPGVSNNASTAFVGPLEGWAISASKPPNQFDSFTNGTGFIFQARPRGSELQHSTLSDGSFQFWSKGAMLTDAGSGNSYSKHSQQHYSLMVNGVGHYTPYFGPYVPYYSKLIAWSNTSDFTYVAADLTQAYARTNRGWYGYPGYHADIDQELYYSGPLWHLTSVKRHILFPRKKYLVIFDTLSAVSNSVFTWLYHVDFVYRDYTFTNLLSESESGANAQLQPNEHRVSMTTNVAIVGRPLQTVAVTLTSAFQLDSGVSMTNGGIAEADSVYRVLVNSTNNTAPGYMMQIGANYFTVESLSAGLMRLRTVNGPFAISTSAGQEVLLYMTNQFNPLTLPNSFALSDGTSMTNGGQMLNAQLYRMRLTSTNVLAPGNLLKVADDLFQVESFISSTELGVRAIYGPFNVSTAADQPVILFGQADWYFISQYASNSMSATWPNFTYTARNAYGPRMNVQVTHISSPSSLTVNDQSNALVRINPFTDEDLSLQEDNRPRANAIWVNSPSSTNWNFVSVVYPFEAGTQPPVITRVSDNTVAITNGAEWDIISSDLNSSVASYIVDIGSAPNAAEDRVTTPSFNPSSGAITPPRQVSIQSDAGTTIFWSTNGFGSSNSVSSPATVTLAFAPITLSAFARSSATNMLDSFVNTVSYSSAQTNSSSPDTNLVTWPRTILRNVILR